MNVEEMEKLSVPPPGWNLEADEELAQFLIQNQLIGGLMDDMHVAQGSEYFSSVEASSEQGQFGATINDLLHLDTEDHFWQSDGPLGSHYLLFFMKPGVVIKKLVDPDDDSYLP